jgi:hypothetical protein
MISTPGYLFTMFTFPGVIVHETAHRFFCDICGVPVYRICYFKKRGSLAGYVLHAQVDSLYKAILISFGPLIINSILCMVLTFPFVIPVFVLHAAVSNPTLWILGWLGLSIGMHAFPSAEDIRQVHVYMKENSYSKFSVTASGIVLKPLIVICQVASMYWFDLFFAIILSLVLPSLL